MQACRLREFSAICLGTADTKSPAEPYVPNTLGHAGLVVFRYGGLQHPIAITLNMRDARKGTLLLETCI